MNDRDYAKSIQVSVSPKKALEAIDDVAAWWTKSFNGAARRVGDTFNVHFGDTSVDFEVVEHSDERIVWHVTRSHLPWLKDKTEWTGTDVVFQLTPDERDTTVHMMHRGLLPTVECYANCQRGWDFYVGRSLHKLLVEGTGLPDGRVGENA